MSLKTLAMTHQEIFKRLHTIIEKIDQQTEVVQRYNLETPKKMVPINQWKQELEELKEKIKEQIK